MKKKLNWRKETRLIAEMPMYQQLLKNMEKYYKKNIGNLTKQPKTDAQEMNETIYNIKVTDRQSFIRFLELLHHDFLKNPDTWENKNLPDFLETMGRYVESLQGYYDNTGQNVNAAEASWKVFFDIFQGAKIQE